MGGLAETLLIVGGLLTFFGLLSMPSHRRYRREGRRPKLSQTGEEGIYYYLAPLLWYPGLVILAVGVVLFVGRELLG